MQGDSTIRSAFETLGTLECPSDVIISESQELCLRKSSSETEGREDCPLGPLVGHLTHKGVRKEGTAKGDQCQDNSLN